jgi:hypothetical protein
MSVGARLSSFSLVDKESSQRSSPIEQSPHCKTQPSPRITDQLLLNYAIYSKHTRDVYAPELNLKPNA